jgi:hypothetical protein
MKEKQKELIEDLAAIVEELGWIIAIPQVEGDETSVNGLIIGTEEFLSNVLAQVETEAEVVEFDTDPKTNTKKLVH